MLVLEICLVGCSFITGYFVKVGVIFLGYRLTFIVVFLGATSREIVFFFLDS